MLDAYSKEIVGWAVGETLETGHCIHALRMALKRVDVTSGKELIHHSDRGCQYASKKIHISAERVWHNYQYDGRWKPQG